MTQLERIRHEVGRIITEELNIELHSTDSDLIDTGLLDSLSLVEMLTHLEQRFGIPVDLGSLELDNLRTISRIGDFVASELAPHA
ncbi:MAG: acyl carrier protein [Acidobacteriota bacterium]|nr:MAG: acyl carrier protein [Acidobacteriota bacterium]